jgi:hypothetical protein
MLQRVLGLFEGATATVSGCQNCNSIIDDTLLRFMLFVGRDMASSTLAWECFN